MPSPPARRAASTGRRSTTTSRATCAHTPRLFRNKRPDADGDEADAGDDLQDARRDCALDARADEDADTGGYDERARRAGEHHPLVDRFRIGCEEHRRELRLVADLGEEHRAEHGGERLPAHGLPRPDDVRIYSLVFGAETGGLDDRPPAL